MRFPDLSARFPGVATFLMLAALAGGTAASVRPAAAQRAPEAKADSLIVAFKEHVPVRERFAALQQHGLQNDPRFENRFLARVLPQLSAALSRAQREGTLKTRLAALRKDPRVRVAEPDFRVRATGVPNDPRFGDQWGHYNVGQQGGSADADVDSTEAWDITTGSGNVVIAVIDTGVEYSHPDLRDNILRDSRGAVVGYDFANNDADPMDDNGHGTHVAGIAGARGNNGIGGVGVAQNVKIMPLKFLDSNGDGSISDAIKCIDWAVSHGAKILNNSWGGGAYSQLLLEAIQRAEDAGILFVAAAGNEGTNNDGVASYPGNYNAACENVISVAATNTSDTLPSFSNYGARSVEIAAPGDRILSTFIGASYDFIDGTSMAAPQVSGAAALILDRYPSLTLAQLKARLLYNTDQPAALDGKVRFGRLNVAKALAPDSAPPGAVAGFAVTHRTRDAILLSWIASGGDGAAGKAGRYELRYSTTPINEGNFNQATAAAGLPDPAPSGTRQRHLLSGLQGGATYYVAIRAMDNVGGYSPVSTAGPVTTLTAAPQVTALEDTVEGTMRFSGVSPWTVTSETSSSPTHSYTDSPASRYVNNLDIALTQLTAVSLADFAPVLTFRARTDLEAGYDFLYVEVSGDDGAGWVRLGDPITDRTAWTTYQVSLAPLYGKSVKVRFRMVSDSSVTQDGLWIDDVRITGTALEALQTASVAPPSGLTVSPASQSSLTLSWADNSSDETGYAVERKDATGGFTVLATLGQDASTFTDGGLEPGATYTYRVGAMSAGLPLYSDEVSGTTFPAAPTAPTGLAAVPGDAKVDLTWTAAPGAASYTVKRSTTPGGPYAAVAATPAASYTDTGLANGTVYYYVVVAENTGGESSPSNEASAAPAGQQAPAAPTNLKVRRAGRSLRLKWTPSATSGVTTQRIYRGRAGAGGLRLVGTVSANQKVYIDKLPRGRVIYVVTAVGGSGVESAPSNQVTATGRR